jgi:transposase
MSLVVNGPASIPLWMEALDGNSSDKTSFHKTIAQVNEFTSQLAIEKSSKWVADSALYNKDKLLGSDYLWLTRVPETVKEAKDLVRADEKTIAWKVLSDGYKACCYTSHYGNCEQRWLLVYSEKACERESATFEKRLKKQTEDLEKKRRKLERELFNCQSDAEKALMEINKNQRYLMIDAQIQTLERYASKGRPTAASETKLVGYQIKGQVCRKEDAIEESLNSKGRFILATNELDEKGYPDELILSEYKEQQHVERGFRFLKDPWFMVDSIFLKSPKRIEALMMVMTLCLLVYNVAQYKLRKKLIELDETLPNQKKKPIQNPTLRWIFQIMEGIIMVSIHSSELDNINATHITNMTETRNKIVRLLGPHACEIYGLIPDIHK